MGLFSSILGGDSSSKSSPYPAEPAWQREMRERLAKLAEPGAKERIGRAGEPYPGPLTAGLSGYEQTGLDLLRKYLGSTPLTQQPLYGMAKEELGKTFGEEYDPAQGEYYKAYRSNMLRELAEAKDRLASRTSARDIFGSTGRVAGEAELEETALGNLTEVLGRLFETERGRKLGAVPMAQQLLAFGEAAPRERIGAATTYGALPRATEQASYDAQYQEWLRQLGDLGIPLDTATGLATVTPPMYQPTYGPSGLSQTMAGLGPLLATIGQKGDSGSSSSGGWEQALIQAAMMMAMG